MAGEASTYKFYDTVQLCNWWLIEADKEFEGKKLAVAGSLKMKGDKYDTVFKSAPITELHDGDTIRAADGMIIHLSGLFNTLKTAENGFSEKVFEHFASGFPTNWKKTINYDKAESEATSSKGNYAEVAPNYTGNMGEDLCTAGHEAAQTGPYPGSPEGSSSPCPASTGKTYCGRMTRSKAVVKSAKEVGSTVNVDVEARSKRRRRESNPPAEALSIRRRSKSCPDGLWWYKYGEKKIKGYLYPKIYYRCKSGVECKAKKYVQRETDDPNSNVTKYKGEHNHKLPLLKTITDAAEGS